MNEISILREIGLSEASRKTHIEAEHLGYIADKNFEKLARLNVHGFVKILKREYDIDFEQWLNEYNAFMAEHGEEVKHKTITISPKIPAYTADGHRSSGGWLWMIIVLILIGFAIWFFEGYKYIGNISNLFEDKNRSVSYSNNVVVNEAKNNLALKDTNLTPNSPSLKPKESEKEEKINEQTETALIIADKTAKEEANTTSELKDDTKTQEEELKTEEKATKEETLETNLKDEANATNLNNASVAENGSNEYLTSNVDEFTITPKSKVWVGIINLEDGKKKTLNSEKPITIEANKKQLIVTGHGNITLNIGDENIKFDAVNPKRFHVEKGKITLITFDEFVELNKGKKW